MRVKEVTTKRFKKADAATCADLIKKARKEYEKPCKGMFEFIDAQGGWLDFTERVFPGEPIRVYRLTHGEICELPMGLVKRLNNTRKKVRKINLHADSNDLKSYEFQSRIRFTPMDAI
jgi:hypothetical protein